MATDLQIKDIQFKRGAKAVLEAKLVDGILGIPKDGEPIYETDTGKLKIGNGKQSYKDLDYFGGEGTAVEVPKFIIKDPLSNQVLFYDVSVGAWVNKDLTDEQSIIYLDDETKGLSLKGYKEASQGFMLVKDETDGLAWVKPLDDTALAAAISAAEKAQGEAGNYATQAGNSAVAAATSASTASRINQQTMN